MEVEMPSPIIFAPPIVLTIDRPLSLGEKIRLLRLSRNWRQFDLAFHSAVTTYAVSLIERDLEYPREALRRIAEALGVELEAG